MSKYKVGDKFIVEIKEVLDGDNGILYRSIFSTLVFDEYGLDKLQKYEDSEYAEGVKEGLNSFDCEVKKAYDKGLQDAWELALKVAASEKYEGIPCDDCMKIFGTICGAEIIRNNTPQEALAKIEAYEESKAIKVGDVVKVDGTNKDCGIVIAIDEIQKKARLMYADTSFRVNEWYLADLKKTGRHIDIEHLLEQIRGGSNED